MAGHVTCMGEMSSVCRIFVGKREGNGPLRIPTIVGFYLIPSESARVNEFIT
jgi:hypothetical protein